MNIIEQLSKNSSIYSSFTEKCKTLIVDLLNDVGINVHHITFRIKKSQSLERKIEAKGNKYKDISEITDICGIRIITYLDSDVNKVAQIIEKEFEVDYANSVDKRKLKADQFGYKSLHYVISLTNERLKLSEYKRYQELKLEIQVRSILQHAWAEIEHDLGYKGEIAIPDKFKRNFNRLSALLETADIEFDRLKTDLFAFKDDVKEDIKKNPKSVKIDQVSIISFIKTNKIFKEALNIIQKNTGCIFYEKNDFIGELERFQFFDIKYIGEISELLNKHRVHYLTFVDQFTSEIREDKLSFGLPLFYFQHYLACLKNSTNYLEEYFEYGNQKMSGVKTANDFLNIFNKSKNIN
ncbi:(p)ppGpp synthetase [Mucilaginibacter sp. JRF]|uniref:GTP pyrophosphokinase n=1 Tax=Mucilaginibacter sp. JRF TaxID=2780088 RepID=UPI00187DFE08|nr:(p)ppGpp synthetase [Mucilaginibacter sp. JRF]MBE9586518.1 (p)ppGpp synthetase [Mucilaginibacter sp. JRF]